MRKGKLAAQVAHSSNQPLVRLLELKNSVLVMGQGMSTGWEADHKELVDTYYNLSHSIEEWLESNYTKIVLGVGSAEELLELVDQAKTFGVDSYPIYDLGLTEFHGVRTLTCASFGPAPAADIDKLTGHLSLI